MCNHAPRRRDDVMRTVPAESGATGRIDGESHAGTPTKAIARQFLDDDVALDSGQPLQLLGYHTSLDLSLERPAGVLPIAAAAAAGHRNDTQRDDAMLGRRHDLDRIGSGEVLRLFGHPRDDPLAGQRVPNEHHPTVVTGHARTAVRGCADLEFENGADETHAAGGFASGGAVPSRGSTTPIDDLSCHGTLTTMTPGVNNRRPFKRKALWLCNRCSHQ